MRFAATLVLVTGCRAVLGLEPPTQTADASTSDAPPDAAFDSPPAARVCGPDNNLVACFDFEGTVVDEAPSPNSVTVANVSFSNSGINGGSIAIDTASRLSIPESVLLDVPNVTIEAWIYMTVAPPAISRSGVFDVNGQYGMFINDGLVLHCTAGMPFDAGSITLDQWTHVACAFAAGKSIAYINGVQVGVALSSGQTLPTSPADGGEIGGNSPDGQERFVGKLDVLRVYRVARSADLICKDAGKMSCN